MDPKYKEEPTSHVKPKPQDSKNQENPATSKSKVNNAQSQVGLEALRILTTIQNRSAELETALRLSNDRNKELSEKFTVSQSELKKAEAKGIELSKLSENLKKTLQDLQINHSRLVEQSKSETSKNLMIKKTFENYVDYAAQSTAEKIRQCEDESKKLKDILAKKEEQLKSSLLQTQEAGQKLQNQLRHQQDLQQQIKRLIAEKTVSQRSFDQRLRAAEQSLLREKSLRKTTQDRITPLELEVQELRQLNESLKKTLKLDQIKPSKKVEAPISTPTPTLAPASTPVSTPAQPESTESAPSHRIEETSDGAVLVWN